MVSQMKYDNVKSSSLSSNDATITEGEPSFYGAKPFSNAWKITVGIVALLDFVSTFMSRRFFLLDHSSGDGDGDHEVTSHLRIFSQNFLLPHQVLAEICLWLYRNNCVFGFLFSILWCIDAFWIADRKADLALTEWERRRFMKTMGSALDSKEVLKLSRLERYKTWLIYVSALLLQFLFLPVGFYVLVFKLFPLNSSTSSSAEEMKALLKSTYHFDNLPEEYRTFSNETKLSLGFAVAKHSGNTIYKVANKYIRKRMRKEGWRKGLKLGWKAILHPIKSWKHGRNVLAWVRWGRYLAPVVGFVFKIRHNLREFILAYKQLQQRLIAERARRLRWIEMTDSERRIRAAKRIQSTYRSYRERQACVDIMLSLQERGEEAAKRLQKAVRVLLENVKAKKQKKEAELTKLESKRRKSIRKGNTIMVMDPKDRERLNELRKETKPAPTRTIDSRLLMRPDTTFQNLWRFLFVCCVLLEMIAHLSNERLVKLATTVNGEAPTVSMKLQNLLLAVPFMDMKPCSCIPQTDQDYRGWEDLRLWTERCNSEPWYCHPAYYYLQTTYAATVHFIIERIMTVMAVVFTLDVPVFFFTGKYQSDTGILVSKPFIKRWIIPGLLLQLLINPQMEAASKVFFKLLHSSFQVGPIRVWRWIRALFYPLLVLLFDVAESFIWIPLVAFANRPNLKTAAPKEKVWENRRRSSINPKRVSIYLSAHAASVQDSTIQRMSYRPSYMGTISPRKSFVKFAK